MSHEASEMRRTRNAGQVLAGVWEKLGSIRLTVILCLLLTLDLSIGFLCLNRRSSLFQPLNEIGLTAWSQTYGIHNLAFTFWFFLLLILLTLLCINTFVCTTDRVVALMRSRKRFGLKRLLFRLAPHVMHYAVIVTLAGYLFSYLFAQTLVNRTLTPGATLTLPETNATVTLDRFDPIYYEGDRLELYKDHVINPRAELILTERKKSDEKITRAVLTFNKPVRFHEYGIFLKNYYPKKKTGGMSRRVRITMTIRKDPGVYLYLTGIVLFTVGLVMYLGGWITVATGGKKITKGEITLEEIS